MTEKIDTVHPPLEEVNEFYGAAPIALDNGMFKCPMPSCDYTADRAQAVGPHKASHARSHGLLAPNGSKKRTREPASKTLKRIPCPVCEVSLTRGHLRAHIQTKHNLSMVEAAALVRPLLESTRGNKTSRNQHTTGVEVAPLTFQQATVNGAASLSPTDMGLAVVMSQLNGSMPTELLPDVVAYIDHTRVIVERLRGEPIKR